MSSNRWLVSCRGYRTVVRGDPEPAGVRFRHSDTPSLPAPMAPPPSRPKRLSVIVTVFSRLSSSAHVVTPYRR